MNYEVYLLRNTNTHLKSLFSLIGLVLYLSRNLKYKPKPENKSRTLKSVTIKEKMPIKTLFP